MMAEATAPLGPQSAASPTPSPRWLRRLGMSPAIVDAVGAQRIYTRIAGWAIQRIAHAEDLATRHASADHGGAPVELLLARLPAMMPDHGAADPQGGATVPGVAGSHADPLGIA